MLHCTYNLGPSRPPLAPSLGSFILLRSYKQYCHNNNHKQCTCTCILPELHLYILRVDPVLGLVLHVILSTIMIKMSTCMHTCTCILWCQPMLVWYQFREIKLCKGLATCILCVSNAHTQLCSPPPPPPISRICDPPSTRKPSILRWRLI